MLIRLVGSGVLFCVVAGVLLHLRRRYWDGSGKN